MCRCRKGVNVVTSKREIYGIDKIALLRYINKKKQAPHVKVGYSH